MHLCSRLKNHAAKKQRERRVRCTLGTRGFSRMRSEFLVLAEGRHIFGRRPKPWAFRAGHYKDLTESRNRARKVSGTQGKLDAKHTKFNRKKVCLLLCMGKQKKTLYLFCVSNYVFSTNVLIWDAIFMSPTGDRTIILCGHRRHTKVVACSVKAIPSFLSYFKTLSIGPVVGITPTSFHSAVKCTIKWANPTMNIVTICSWLLMH